MYHKTTIKMQVPRITSDNVLMICDKVAKTLHRMGYIRMSNEFEAEVCGVVEPRVASRIIREYVDIEEIL
jgi:hypothetical protein